MPYGRYRLEAGLDVGHPPFQDGLQFTQQISAFPMADHPRSLVAIDTLHVRLPPARFR